MDVALEMARGHLDGELAWIIGDILANRTAWWVPGKIIQARHRLKQYWQVILPGQGPGPGQRQGQS